MVKHKTSNATSILGIHNFRHEQTAGRSEILFNEIIGEKTIKIAHSHDFFIIILFNQGEGTHNIDAINYNIGNKELHILFPGQLHKWELKDNTMAYQLMVEQELLEQFAPFFKFSFTNYQNHPVIKLNEESFKNLEYEFNAIKNELETNHSHLHLISARAAVIAALISIQAEKSFTEFKVYQSNSKLAEFNMYIDRYFKEQKTVNFYATELNISANYLNILCKRHLKISAIQLIHQRIITEAKRLLQNYRLTIKEITYELGFTDTAHFSNFFKKQTKLTASEFRKMMEL